MKRFAEMLGKEAFKLEPEAFDSEEAAVKEVIESFSDEDAHFLFEIMLKWAEEKTGQKIDVVPLN